jgi:hypothetical protein
MDPKTERKMFSPKELTTNFVRDHDSTSPWSIHKHKETMGKGNEVEQSTTPPPSLPPSMFLSQLQYTGQLDITQKALDTIKKPAGPADLRHKVRQKFKNIKNGTAGKDAFLGALWWDSNHFAWACQISILQFGSIDVSLPIIMYVKTDTSFSLSDITWNSDNLHFCPTIRFDNRPIVNCPLFSFSSMGSDTLRDTQQKDTTEQTNRNHAKKHSSSKHISESGDTFSELKKYAWQFVHQLQNDGIIDERDDTSEKQETDYSSNGKQVRLQSHTLHKTSPSSKNTTLFTTQSILIESQRDSAAASLLYYGQGDKLGIGLQPIYPLSKPSDGKLLNVHYSKDGNKIFVGYSKKGNCMTKQGHTANKYFDVFPRPYNNSTWAFAWWDVDGDGHHIFFLHRSEKKLVHVYTTSKHQLSKNWKGVWRFGGSHEGISLPALFTDDKKASEFKSASVKTFRVTGKKIVISTTAGMVYQFDSPYYPSDGTYSNWGFSPLDTKKESLLGTLMLPGKESQWQLKLPFHKPSRIVVRIALGRLADVDSEEEEEEEEEKGQKQEKKYAQQNPCRYEICGVNGDLKSSDNVEWSICVLSNKGLCFRARHQTIPVLSISKFQAFVPQRNFQKQRMYPRSILYIDAKSVDSGQSICVQGMVVQGDDSSGYPVPSSSQSFSVQQKVDKSVTSFAFGQNSFNIGTEVDRKSTSPCLFTYPMIFYGCVLQEALMWGKNIGDRPIPEGPGVYGATGKNSIVDNPEVEPHWLLPASRGSVPLILRSNFRDADAFFGSGYSLNDAINDFLHDDDDENVITVANGRKQRQEKMAAKEDSVSDSKYPMMDLVGGRTHSVKLGSRKVSWESIIPWYNTVQLPTPDVALPTKKDKKGVPENKKCQNINMESGDVPFQLGRPVISPNNTVKDSGSYKGCLRAFIASGRYYDPLFIGGDDPTEPWPNNTVYTNKGTSNPLEMERIVGHAITSPSISKKGVTFYRNNPNVPANKTGASHSTLKLNQGTATFVHRGDKGNTVSYLSPYTSSAYGKMNK